MIVLGIDPAASKPIHVARFVDGEFAGIETVPYRYAEQPVMFFDTFKRMFRDALCDVTCPECEWKGRKRDIIPTVGHCPRCKQVQGMTLSEGGALVAIEKPNFLKGLYAVGNSKAERKKLGAMFQSFIKFHAVFIALKTIAMYEGIGFMEFDVSTWRSIHGIKRGKDVKKQAVEKVFKLTGKRFSGNQIEREDKSESFLIGLAAMTPKHKIVTIKE